MIIGQTYRHKHNPKLVCTIKVITTKGAKVEQTEYRIKKQPKVTTQFYNKMDFEGPLAFWVLK